MLTLISVMKEEDERDPMYAVFTHLLISFGAKDDKKANTAQPQAGRTY